MSRVWARALLPARQGTIDREPHFPRARSHPMLKPAFTALTVMLVLSLAFSAGAQDLNQALAKYRSGDYTARLQT